MQPRFIATLQPQKMTLSQVSPLLLYKDLPRSHGTKRLAMGCVSALSTQPSACRSERHQHAAASTLPPSQWGRTRTALSQPWASLCSIYTHHCFTPEETRFPQLRGRLGLTNFINNCKALGEAQTDGCHKVQSAICAEKMLFGPETLKGIKMPSRAPRGERGQLCAALLGTLPWVHLEAKCPVHGSVDQSGVEPASGPGPW